MTHTANLEMPRHGLVVVVLYVVGYNIVTKYSGGEVISRS